MPDAGVLLQPLIPWTFTIPKVEAKEKTEEIALPKTPRDPIHHIVAQTDPRAAPAQAVLEEAGINRFIDPANLVALPVFYHRRIHSQFYYDYVNAVVTTAWSSGGTAGVYTALGFLKWEIITGTLW
jgi:hypothetical protein